MHVIMKAILKVESGMRCCTEEMIAGHVSLSGTLKEISYRVRPSAVGDAQSLHVTCLTW